MSVLSTLVPSGDVVVASPPPRCATPRLRQPRSHGKFLFVGDEKLHVRGRDIWTIPSGSRTARNTTPARQVQRDFAQMAAAGINTVRVYTIPAALAARRAAEKACA